MSNDPDRKETHFGFSKVDSTEKSSLVAQVFRSVAPNYDLMNDLMSFGLHRLWKRQTLAEANVKSGQFVLDVASGTGDLAKAFAKLVGSRGREPSPPAQSGRSVPRGDPYG